MPERTEETAHEEFVAEYEGGMNFMTPTAIRYGWCGDEVAYELSQGSSFCGGTMYGVTFLRVRGDGSTEKMYEQSSGGHSLEAAERVIEWMKDEEEE